MREITIWEGRPSHVLNLPSYSIILCILLLLHHLLGRCSIMPYRELMDLFADSIAPSPIVTLLFIMMLAATLYGLILFLDTQFTNYHLTNQRLFVRRLQLTGIRTDQTELYKVIEYVLIQPYFLLLFGLANVRIDSHDVSNPTLYLKGIRHAKSVVSAIREHVEKAKTSKGVTELNINQ